MTSALAIIFVVGQGLVVWGFLRFVRSFGAYTESHKEFMRALLYVNRSNIAMHQHSMQVLTELRALREALNREAA